MKRQDILEIIVSNPRAIFRNSNTETGKYSEYPRYFQIIGTTDDKSYVRVRQVTPQPNDYLLNETGGWLRDENNSVIADTRPLVERATIKHGEIKRMPTRLVLKSDLTEESMLSNFIAEEQARQTERDERDAQYEKGKETIAEIAPLLVAVGFIEKETDVTESYGTRWGRVSLDLEGEQLERLTSLLKSALVEVGA